MALRHPADDPRLGDGRPEHREPFAVRQVVQSDLVGRGGRHGEQTTVGIHRGVSDNEVRVWGDYPLGSRPFGARLSIHDPALRAARLFMDALKARGITVEGAAHTRDFRVPTSERFDPSRAVELAYVSSKPLSEIV